MSHEKKSSHQHHHRECEYKMDSDIDIDSKEKTFEGLFDSGYNSNIQSKTFLDLDNEEFDNSSLSNQQQHLDRSQQSNSNRRLLLTQQQTNDANDKNKFDTVQQWSDSGVCITDSGLSIQEDFENYDPIDSNENDQESKQQKIDTQQSHSLANDSNDNKNALELWLKHNSDAET